jgi:dATP pyrophosphohydrolase
VSEAVAGPRAPKIPRSVLVVIHTPALDVLLIERADRPGFWQSVTGSLDREDEPLRETAVREVMEETGIDVAAVEAAGGALRDWGRANVYEIFPAWRHRYAPGVTHNTEHVFGLTVPPGTPVVLSPREHLAHAWLPWREAAARCFSPSNAEAIRMLPGFVSDMAVGSRPPGRPKAGDIPSGDRPAYPTGEGHQ